MIYWISPDTGLSTDLVTSSHWQRLEAKVRLEGMFPQLKAAQPHTAATGFMDWHLGSTIHVAESNDASGFNAVHRSQELMNVWKALSQISSWTSEWNFEHQQGIRKHGNSPFDFSLFLVHYCILKQNSARLFTFLEASLHNKTNNGA